MPKLAEQTEWFSLIDISGPFLAGKVLEDAFPQGLDKVETPRRQRLRAAYEEWRDAVDEADTQLAELHDAWTRMVVAEALEYEGEVLVAREQLNGQVVHRVPEHGVEETPDFAVRTDDGVFRLLISTYPPGTDLERPSKHDRWPVSPAERMTSLCRASEVRLGLITNGEQWMLVNAPIGSTSSYASWFARIWWQEPITFKAFVSLLGVRRCFGTDEGRLDQLLEASLEFQEEITDSLGEQVRRAVEVLIQALGRADEDRNGELLKDVSPEVLYEAGLTVMMRLVFILCAEERDLLLLGDPNYDQHYAISSLRARLREDADQHGVEVLERRKDAWSRILTVFRMVYAGVEHEALRLPVLGGSLFDPDRFPFLEGRSAESSWREEAASPLPIDNRTVLLLMNALQVLEQKGGAQLLSYRALDVEQIGHVYEGLLEYTVARLPEPTVALIGSKKVPRPSITVRELEAITAEPVDTAAKKLSDLTGRSKSPMKTAINSGGDEAHLVALIQSCGGDEALAKRLLPFARLIRADSWESLLVYHEGSFAVVPGTDRRETGTHYTPRSLTETIVEKTLEPIVYAGPAEGIQREDWKLKAPAELLELKICDPAMGSGAFLVEACRYLSQRLVEAWRKQEDAGRVVNAAGEVLDSIDDHEPMTENLDDRLVLARRLVADRCLYGVDKNPLAVELAKLSLWLVTLSKNRPFAFLDHALRPGDSLVGLTDIQQLELFALNKTDSVKGSLFGQMTEIISNVVTAARMQRNQLEHNPSNTFADIAAKTSIYEHVKRQAACLKYLADVIIACYWEERGDRVRSRLQRAFHEHFDRFRNGSLNEHVSAGHAVRVESNCPTTFHWPIEFPEVFERGKDEPAGFDAIVGNPPFLGGKRITGALGASYRDFVVRVVADSRRGNADLCCYFCLRFSSIVREGGMIGMLATNTLCQGETRQVGLNRLRENDFSIPFAVKSRKWPGKANLAVSIVWLRRGSWPKGYFSLDGRLVNEIASTLEVPGQTASEPYRLTSNIGKAFQGSNIRGIGFTLSIEQAETYIHESARNKEVLFPFLGGKDILSSPTQQPSRWVINFFDWDEARAASYPDLFKIVRERVLPEREKINDKRKRTLLSRLFWQYDSQAKQLYRMIRTTERYLVHPFTGKHHVFFFCEPGITLAHTTTAVVLEGWDDFAVLQSNIHWVWALEYGNKLETRPQYSPTQCFDTYPMPDTAGTPLESIGRCLHSLRKDILESRNKGATAIYNLIDSPAEASSDITELRDLYASMDNAVAAAYGWGDLDLGHGFHETRQGLHYAISEEARQAVLQRLLNLNHKRYAEELKRGLHGRQ